MEDFRLRVYRESKDSAERSLLYALDELIDLHAFGNASDSLREAVKLTLGCV